MLLVIAHYIYLLISMSTHPFHVSVSEVYFNEKAHSLEISMKIFTDDFELAIQKRGNAEFRLLDTKAEIVDEETIRSYLIDNFKIGIDGELVNLDFVGFEFDGNATLCYFEGRKVKKINNIEIDNSIITEVFDDQINLTHFHYKEEMKSLKATKGSTVGLINTSGW